ncbi:Solute carrier family 35 member G1 [Halotydeus destructor]|nr:Solute carrier family 35 member G1 [Halotydeus destructor]
MFTEIQRLPCFGILLGLLSGVFAATGGFIVKLLPDVHPVEVVVARSFIQLLVSVSMIYGSGMSFYAAPGEEMTLRIRSFAGFMSTALAYTSFTLIPLADASTLIFAAPVFVSGFAWAIYREPCGLFQISNILVTLTGVVLIAKPSAIFGSIEIVPEVDRIFGTTFALISSLSISLSFVLVRKLQNTSSDVIVLWFSVYGVVCGLMALIVLYLSGVKTLRIPDQPHEIMLLLANGLCGVISQPLQTAALKIEEASVIALSRTIDVVMAFIFQIIFLQEQVHWTSMIGATIICFGVGVSIARKWFHHHADPVDSVPDEVPDSVLSGSKRASSSDLSGMVIEEARPLLVRD